jgi:hypothetical protein
MTDFPGYSRNKEWKEMERNLHTFAPVRPATYRLSEVFVLIFREQLMTDSPEDPEAEDILNQSNWTYHTAFSIRKTSGLLDLICKFEETGTKGRLDAIIKTRKNKEVLIAEWEAKYKNICRQGEELEKLWRELKNLPGVDGLLLTYCPTNDYFNFVNRVLEDWQKRSFVSRPSLYLLY